MCLSDERRFLARVERDVLRTVCVDVSVRTDGPLAEEEGACATGPLFITFRGAVAAHADWSASAWKWQKAAKSPLLFFLCFER